MFQIVSLCFLLFQIVTIFNDEITKIIPISFCSNKIETSEMYKLWKLKSRKKNNIKIKILLND